MVEHNKIVSVVEAIVKDGYGRILLLERSDKNTYYKGEWQLPGGKVEFGEDIHTALNREIAEETGCVCTDFRLERVFSLDDKFNGHKGTLFLMVFVCVLYGKICLSEDHSNYKFFYIDEIKNLGLTPTSKKAIFG